MSRAATRLQPLEIPGPAGGLEALYQAVEDHDHDLAAVVCHPHPLYGGTLHNKVVHRVAASLHGLGAAVLRFNFRGVGASAGRFDRGEGELEDAAAALAWLRARAPGARLWLAGFSFGSWIAARLAAREPEVAQLVLVAPPVQRSEFHGLRTLGTPKLILQGTADDICPLEALEQVYPDWAEPKRLVRIPEGTHFFDRRLAQLGEAIAEALGPLARGTPTA